VKLVNFRQAQLISLYDMVSNMMDGSWMNEEQKDFYLDYTLKLKDAVQRKFGDLNIVKIAESFTYQQPADAGCYENEVRL